MKLTTYSASCSIRLSSSSSSCRTGQQAQTDACMEDSLRIFRQHNNVDWTQQHLFNHGWCRSGRLSWPVFVNDGIRKLTYHNVTVCLHSTSDVVLAKATDEDEETAQSNNFFLAELPYNRF